MLRRIVNGARTALARRASRLLESSGSARPVRFERLEPRLLLSAGGPPCITDIIADNRGRIVLRVQGDLDGNSVNANSVKVFTAGPDRRFGTGDEVLLSHSADYDADTDEISVNAPMDPNTRYLVRLDSSIIREPGVGGLFLDGEFNGAGVPTGNGLAGGDLAFYTKGAQRRIARIDTNVGVMNVELFHDLAPISVANFLAYADSGRWDATIVHRSVTDFVIQAGGYNNNTRFTRVVKDPAILNEFGVSNTRGTIAYAKTGGNPNSATSEWFFNIGDNSANLDNQNGGFTVFGKITDDAGLAVMDFINGLPIVNASGVNTAFNEFPLNGDVAGNPNAINPDVSVEIERVSLLMDIVAAPPEQIQSDFYDYGSNRDAFITVYDFGGIGRAAIDDILDVRFEGNRVSSITIKGAFPPGALGISINNATRVGSIKTAGAGRGSEIRFIFSSAPIESMNIQGSITGFNLNGLLFGDTLLAEDADGDGSLVEMTSVMINSGVSSKVNVKGTLGGDFLAPGGLRSLTVSERLENATLQIGAVNEPFAFLSLRLADVVNTTLDTQTPIGFLKADSWTTADGGESVISAQSLQSRTISGVFGATLELSGGVGPDLNTLQSANIGSLIGAELNINGGVGPFSVRGLTSNTTLSAVRGMKFSLGDVEASDFTVGSALTSLKMGSLTSSNFTAQGEIPSVSVDGWSGGGLTAHRIKTLSSGRGVFAANLNLTGASGEGDALRKASFRGGLGGGAWEIRGDVKSISVRGESRDTDINVRGDLGVFTTGVSSNVDLGATGDIKKITAVSWTRGEIAFTHLGSLTTTGGDDLGGSFRGDIRGMSADKIAIAGDMRIASIRLTPIVDFISRPVALKSLTVNGDMEFVEFRTTGIVENVTARRMLDSAILGSATLEQRLPQDSNSVTPFSRIERLTLTSNARDTAAFRNNFIVVGSIGDMTIGAVDPFNFSVPFGIATNEITGLNYFSDVGEVSLRRPQLGATPAAFGDFQVRVAFALPEV
jgi:cyclophilin family peptidyl-prolyl cis-trans isomerase